MVREARGMADELTLKDFEERIGDEFVAAGDEGATRVLRLDRAEALGEGPEGHRDPFSLIFHEPRGTVLPQQTHALTHEAMGELQIFLVPIGPDAEGMRYEAVFA
jgi:hypothetical protein